MTAPRRGPALQAVASLLTPRSRATVDDLAARCGLKPATVGKALAQLEREGAAARVRPASGAGGTQPDRWRAVATKAADDRGRRPRAVSSRRLGRGELRASVLAYFQANPGREFGPTALGHALDRSVGAIGNAAETLADSGEIARTCAAPRRYAYQP